MTNTWTISVRLLPANKALGLNYTWGVFIDGLLAEAGFECYAVAQRHAAIMACGFAPLTAR